MGDRTRQGGNVKKAKAERYVIVATKSRPWSVLAGVLVSEDEDTVELRDARMLIYWSADARGLYGVASGGPGTSARVSLSIARARVRGVEHTIDCTDEARKAIEAAPWK